MIKNAYNSVKSIIRSLNAVRHKLLSPKIKLHNRHDSYASYVEKQKEKTLDPARIEKWLGEEWHEKLDGFRALFERNDEFVKPASRCICLGARTGQEVAALQELGKEAIGIDLVAFPPLTVEGDIHDLSYADHSFDFVFTNIFDHSLYPDKFIAEMERVCETGGHIIVNLQLYTPGDEYSENIINDANKLIDLFQSSELACSRPITNSFDGMNWEVVMRKV